MATKKTEAEPEVDQKMKFATADEAKWGSVNFRTSLWTYFFTISKGKPLTAKDIKLVEKTFRQIQEANEALFGEVEIEKGEGSARRSKQTDVLELIGPEINKVINANSIKDLKKIWNEIIEGDKYDSLKRKEKKYLDDIKENRKAELIAAGK